MCRLHAQIGRLSGFGTLSPRPVSGGSSTSTTSATPSPDGVAAISTDHSGSVWFSEQGAAGAVADRTVADVVQAHGLRNTRL
jgi:hypothetical protein